MMQMHTMLRAYPCNVSVMRNAARRYAASVGACPRTQDDVALAVSEALTNVVVHAYRDRDEPGYMTIDAAVDGDALVLRIADEGEGVRPQAHSPGLGRGLPLMAAVSESLTVSDGQRGQVDIRFARLNKAS